jgi:drug/metabolite transporter (DMT)-like permease
MHRLSPRDLWLLALLTLSWGINWPIMKIGVSHFAPLTFRVLSMVGGLIVLGIMVRQQRQSFHVATRHWPELILIALFNMTLWFMFSIYGIKLLSSGRAAIIGYTLPVWTAIWGRVIYGERLGPRLFGGVLAAALGVLLLLSSEARHIAGRPLGALLMLAAACIWAYGTHRMRRRRLPTPLLVITFWSLVISLCACALAAWVLERPQWVRLPDTAEWGAIGYNALVIFAVSQLIWFHLVSVLTPTASTLSVMLIPVIGLFSGMLILGEQPAWQDWVALVSILLAIALALLPSRAART